MRYSFLLLVIFFLSFSGYGQVYKLSLDEMESFMWEGPKIPNDYLVPKGWVFIPQDSAHSYYMNVWEYFTISAEGDTNKLAGLQCYHFEEDPPREAHSVWYYYYDQEIYDNLQHQGILKGMKKIATGIDKINQGPFTDYKIKGHNYIVRFVIVRDSGSGELLYATYLIDIDLYKDQY